ncbi:cytochrome P450 [Aspergillus floccosus]
MDDYGLNYSILSITAPGVNFLASKPKKAQALARELNHILHDYTQTHPTKLGALCLLPLPNVKHALAEISYCLDELDFDGVGLYTNYNGLYLGDERLDPVFQALNERNATVFVHPTIPGCQAATLGYGGPLTEYPFDTIRAVENMLLTGQRQRYPNVTMIFPHGGGAIPYLAGRIAGVATLDELGALDPAHTIAQLRGYYFDTASAYSAIQLQALKAFGGVGRIVTGTDFPYVPVNQAKPGLASIQANGGFNSSEMGRINNGNVLSIFPRIRDKLRLLHIGLALLLLSLYLLRLITNRFKSGLRDIPGPALAKHTRLWKLYSVWKGDHHTTEINLHRKYGPLVRIGPNHVSVGDPSAIPIIYGLNQGFTKTGFYPIQSISWEKRPQMNLFSTRDEAFHRSQKRPVANAYSMTSLLEMEDAVDSCTHLFMNRLREFSAHKTAVDLGTWLQYYAFDVIGEVTFAKKLGFLEEGRDVDDMMETIQGILQYASLCGQIPDAHPFLLGNPLFPVFIPSMESWNQVLQFTLKALNARVSLGKDQDNMQEHRPDAGNDMLSRWLAIHRSDPQKLSKRDIIVHTSTNVFAGSDTTAIALRAIFYLLLRHPSALAKVQNEIDTADKQGKLSNPISYRESVMHFPYLAAVFKEAMRLHPSVGLILERHVPPQGASIAGKHIPAGTVVGINAWVLHQNPDVYPNPEVFVPERWLESSPAELKAMEQSFFAFGAGSRTCIGKNISLMEMHKIVPQILREFEVRLHEPEREWKTRNVWFVQQEGLVRQSKLLSPRNTSLLTQRQQPRLNHLNQPLDMLPRTHEPTLQPKTLKHDLYVRHFNIPQEPAHDNAPPERTQRTKTRSQQRTRLDSRRRKVKIRIRVPSTRCLAEELAIPCRIVRDSNRPQAKPVSSVDFLQRGERVCIPTSSNDSGTHRQRHSHGSATITPSSRRDDDDLARFDIHLGQPAKRHKEHRHQSQLREAVPQAPHEDILVQRVEVLQREARVLGVRGVTPFPVHQFLCCGRPAVEAVQDGLVGGVPRADHSGDSVRTDLEYASDGAVARGHGEGEWVGTGAV